MKKLLGYFFLVFCLLFFFENAKAASPFNDVSSDDPNWGWAYPYIVALQQNNITNGCGNGNYCPGNLVTRGQTAAFIDRMVEGNPTNYSQSPYFLDVPQNHWAFGYVQRMKELNIMQGYANGLFGVDDQITRDQMAKVIILGMVKKNLTSDPPANYCQGQAPFNDVDPSYWACPYIKKLKELGASGYGDGGYHPTDYVNRAQMAAFLGKFFLGLSDNVKNPAQGFEYVQNTIDGIKMLTDSMQVIGGSGAFASVASVLRKNTNTLTLKNIGSASGQKLQSSFSKAIYSLSSATSTMASTSSIPCNSGNAFVDQPDSYNFTIQFNQCALGSSSDYSVFNGQLSVSGSGSNYAITYGNGQMPLNIKSYSSGVLEGELNVGLKFQMNNVTTTANGFSSNITTNGYIEENDNWMYAKFSYNNFALALDYSVTTSTQINAKVNGSASVDANLKGQSLGIITLNENYNNLQLNISSDSQYIQLSVNGGLMASTNPTTLCSNGTYNFQTITPIKKDMSLDRLVSGKMNINDAVIIINPDGTMTVNSNGQSFTYNDPNNIPGICSF